MPRRGGARHAAIARAARAALAIALLAAAPAGALVPCADPVRGTGEATYYAYPPGGGACSFTGDDDEALVAALGLADYADGAMCGRWLRVTGPRGSVTVRVVDKGPALPPGHIDLNRPAFAAIADPAAGRVAVTWETVAAPSGEGLTIAVGPGSNAWWVALQVRHHRYGIASLEILAARGFVAAPRTDWDHFVVDGGLGLPLPIAQPFTVRVTDVNGQQLVVTGLRALAGHEFRSAQQFPLCTGDPDLLPPTVGAGLALLPPAPAAFGPRTTITFEATGRAPLSLRVYDARGRRVATLLDGAALPAGRRTATWDGRDDRGRPVAGGAYLLRLESGGSAVSRRVVRLG